MPVTDATLEADIKKLVRIALEEDIGTGDITAALIPEGSLSHAKVISRENAILCGCAWFSEVFQQLNADICVEWLATDGDSIEAGQTLCTLHGDSRSLLSGERSALNFLQTLSGTATRAHEYVQATAGTGAIMLDTRKTLPGLRTAQKYAMVCGGGHNHRIGLFDAFLIKENHILAAGSITAAIERARAIKSSVAVQVEVENFEELQEAIKAGAEKILLDNMSIEKMREAVAITRGRATLEASGGVTLDNVHVIAETGVDFISSGDITKDLHAVDLSMCFLN